MMRVITSFKDPSDPGGPERGVGIDGEGNLCEFEGRRSSFTLVWGYRHSSQRCRLIGRTAEEPDGPYEELPWSSEQSHQEDHPGTGAIVSRSGLNPGVYWLIEPNAYSDGGGYCGAAIWKVEVTGGLEPRIKPTAIGSHDHYQDVPPEVLGVMNLQMVEA